MGVLLRGWGCGCRQGGGDGSPDTTVQESGPTSGSLVPFLPSVSRIMLFFISSVSLSCCESSSSCSIEDFRCFRHSTLQSHLRSQRNQQCHHRDDICRPAIDHRTRRAVVVAVHGRVDKGHLRVLNVSGGSRGDRHPQRRGPRA